MLKREVKFFTAISKVLKLLKSKVNLEKYLAINKSHFFHPESSRLWTEHQFRLKGNKYFLSLVHSLRDCAPGMFLAYSVVYTKI